MKVSIHATLNLLASCLILATIVVSCNDAAGNDQAIEAAAEKALKSDPSSATTVVDVTDGVATISGECADQGCKERCEKLVADVKGVKSVVNNCTVAKKVETAKTDEELSAELFEISKDITTIKIGAMDGIVGVAGNLTRQQWTDLKAKIDRLNPKGYDTASLRIE